MSNLYVRIRNSKIAQWATDNPCSSLQEIGDYYGITRERVRQILQKQGVHKQRAFAPYAGPVCSECAKRMPQAKADEPLCRKCRGMMFTMICTGCGEPFERSRRMILFAQRYQVKAYRGTAVYCTRACWAERADFTNLTAAGTKRLQAYAKMQREKTHCKYGHERKKHSYVSPNGSRRCRPCNRERGKRWRKKNAKV